MLCGFDDDIHGPMTTTSNRIRGLLTKIHSALERVVGHLGGPGMLDLLKHYLSTSDKDNRHHSDGHPAAETGRTGGPAPGGGNHLGTGRTDRRGRRRPCRPDGPGRSP